MLSIEEESIYKILFWLVNRKLKNIWVLVCAPSIILTVKAFSHLNRVGDL